MARRIVGLAVGVLGTVLVLPPNAAAAEEEPLPEPAASNCVGQFTEGIAQEAGPNGTTNAYGFAPGIGNLGKTIFSWSDKPTSTALFIIKRYCNRDVSDPN